MTPRKKFAEQPIYWQTSQISYIAKRLEPFVRVDDKKGLAREMKRAIAFLHCLNGGKEELQIALEVAEEMVEWVEGGRVDGQE